MNRPISIGVSACLLGHRVRHDGDHRLQPTIKDDLEELFQLQPICPEVESGMGVPRTPIQLVETRYGVRALEIQDPGKDYTQKLGQVAKDWVCANPAICGLILKSKSPSCGLGSTKIFNQAGEISAATGYGVFAQTVRDLLPGIPYIDEIQFSDQQARIQFIHAVQHYHSASNSMDI